MIRAISLLFHDVYVSHPDESGFTSEAANRYKLTQSDFDAQLAGIERVRSDAPILAAAVTNGMHTGTPPYLITVDDGGVSYYTVVADRLETRGWRGHCFVTTDFVGRRGFLERDQLRELAARGHAIGSHSASHPTPFSELPFDRMVAEWSRSRAVLEDLLGCSVETGSVPGGHFSMTVADAAREAGIRVLFTSEPVTHVDLRRDQAVVGRFTVRRGDPPDLAQRFVLAAPWTRSLAWASWNAKGLVKPVLGPAYMRIADWLLTPRASGRT